MGGRVGAERQPVRGRRRTQVVQDDSWLDDGGAGHRVQLGDAPHVTGEVQDDAGAGGLTGDGGAGAAGHDRRGVLPADAEGLGDVRGVAGGHDRLWDAAVVGRVHGRQGAGCRVGLHVAVDGPGQGSGEVGGGHGSSMPVRGLTGAVIARRTGTGWAAHVAACCRSLAEPAGPSTRREGPARRGRLRGPARRGRLRATSRRPPCPLPRAGCRPAPSRGPRAGCPPP